MHSATTQITNPDLRAAIGDLLDFDEHELAAAEKPSVQAAELAVKLRRAVAVIGVLLDERLRLLGGQEATPDTATAAAYPYPVNAVGPAPAVPPELLAALRVTR